MQWERTRSLNMCRYVIYCGKRTLKIGTGTPYSYSSYLGAISLLGVFRSVLRQHHHFPRDRWLRSGVHRTAIGGFLLPVSAPLQSHLPKQPVEPVHDHTKVSRLRVRPPTKRYGSCLGNTPSRKPNPSTHCRIPDDKGGHCNLHTKRVLGHLQAGWV